MSRYARTLALLALLALVVGACAPAPATKASLGPVKVGIMTVLTGPAASVGSEQRNWTKLAVDQFNKAGGIGGQEVELVEGDTEFDPAKAVLAAERLIADASVYGVVGPESSQNCEATAKAFEQASLVNVSPSGTGASLSEQGYKTFFRVVPRDDVQAPAGAAFIARDLGARSVHIIDDQSVYSVGLATEAQKELTALGVASIKRDSISQKDSDFSALLTRIKAEAPDAIYMPIQLAAQGAQIAKQMRELGVTATVVGSDGLFSPDDFIAGAEGATEGAYVTQFAPDVHYIKEAEAAVQEYEAQYGQFGAYGPPAYESAAVLLDAMKRAYEKDGRLTREAVVREMRATKDRPGILGFEVSFDERGDAVGSAFYMFKVVGDQFELVKKVELR